jgi:hypothetical protein
LHFIIYWLDWICSLSVRISTALFYQYFADNDNMSAAVVKPQTETPVVASSSSMDTSRQMEILKSKHKRQIEELGEPGPSLQCFRKRCNKVALNAAANANDTVANNRTMAPSLDEAVNLLGHAPTESGVLASELGLLIYGSQSDTAKKIIKQVAESVKDMTAEEKEKEKEKEAAMSNAMNNEEDDGRRSLRFRSDRAAQGAGDAAHMVVSNRGTGTGTATGTATGESVEEEEEGEGEEEEQDEADDWVQCEQCEKWRRLPPKSNPNYPKELAERWSCFMNTWEDGMGTCSAPEESFNKKKLTRVGIKAKIWLRRIRSGDRYAKLYANNHGDSNYYKADGGRGVTDWIRCSSPQCGKWRACLRNMTALLIRERYPNWTCWMNSWDETRASCTAPQEGMGVRSLAEVEVDEQMAIEEEKKEEEAETSMGLNNSMASTRVHEDDDEIEYSRGVSQRGRIVRSRWTAQVRRRFLGK